MNISVVIPVYNADATIEATLESVLRQTIPPHEILIVDDGSTDSTVSILNSYKPRVRVLQQENKGVATARNVLCRQAKGDLIAFLDADDIWHPSYLQVQRGLFEDHPNAVASFTGHVDFYGDGTYEWHCDPPDAQPNVEMMGPLSFLKKYNETTGRFASMSYCCITKRVLTEIGDEPFCVSGAEDYYLLNLLPRWGAVVYSAVPLVAYRITSGSLSSDRLKVVGLSVKALEVLNERYTISTDARIGRMGREVRASRRRLFAKLLMGSGDVSEARRHFKRSLRDSGSPLSKAKSATLLLLTYMPMGMQPTWPPRYRQSQDAR